MFVRSRILFLIPLCCLVFSSCEKDEEIKPDPGTLKGDLVVSFRALVNNEILEPNTHFYYNAADDTFSVSKFNYYISNVKLRTAQGKEFAEPESYHLIRHVEGETTFTITNIPQGEYNYVEFMIGVDSLRNVSGAQTGALDPANNMFWDWNTGYIFYKLEGFYRTANIPDGNYFAIHIGGFQAPYNCLQTPTFDLKQPVKITQGKQSRLLYDVIVEEVFVNPKLFGIEFYFATAGPKTDKEISINYKDMFMVDRVIN